MDRDDIIRMADEASGGRPADGWGVMLDHQQLERFAALIAAGEREACAKLCDKIADDDGFEGGYADYCAHAIRARGQE